MKEHFKIEDGHLLIGGVDTVKLAEKYGTPLYVTDEKRIRERARKFKRAFPSAELLYAAKANWNISILRIMAEEGFGADVFSDGELYAALLAGIQKEKILFNGNSKSPRELKMALEADVKISIDSEDELITLAEMADKEIEVSFRVNPNISVKTHPKIATGLRESKFGIPAEEATSIYEKAIRLDNIRPIGIHCHIGSQILDISPYRETIERMMDLVAKLTEIGIDIKFVDVGGGLGISYSGEKERRPSDLASLILPIFERRCEEIGIKPILVLEPGRYLVADSTILLTRVNAVKKAYKNFVAVDAGFNIFIRPAMYEAYHEIAIANKMNEEAEETYTVVGPICETGDILGRDRKLPKVKRGDLLAIFDTGAYGFSMSSQYNGRPRPAEILVNDGSDEVIRYGEEYSDLIVKMNLPARLM
ncbi:MAG: Diaminopimelate decarboxylase [Candidatus Methanolliviera sp. GoM_asphalt]|nr:MAG: Diaminopimelate decarboxylase [Candidatus Methanolliviera sp. GoM_asphalt]